MLRQSWIFRSCVILVAIAGALVLASCSDSPGGDRAATTSGQQVNVYEVTISSIEIENADTGEPLAVGGDEISGQVVISDD